MSTKSQALERLREQMYEHISSVQGRFSELSNIEKAIFFQQAFNNVDKYCSTKWNMKTGTPFGFIIGRQGSLATAFGREKAITANVRYVIHSKNPEDVYKTFFHEERHIRQFKTREMSTQVQRLFGAFLSNKEGVKSAAQWNASPMEIQADNFSYKEMIKTNKAMLKNPETRVQAAQNIRELRIARVKNAFEHVKGVARVAASPILAPLQKLFSRNKSEENYVGKVVNGGMRVLNLKELTEVFAKNPQNFTREGNPTDGPVIRSFIASRGDQSHFLENFFGYHREQNQRESQQALQQFQQGQNPAENNLTNPQGFSQNPEFIDKDLTLNSTPVLDKQEETIVEGKENQVANGNTTLKDEIINNIIASRTADKENETVSTETSATPVASDSSVVSSESVTVDSTAETSADMGGMTQ